MIDRRHCNAQNLMGNYLLDPKMSVFFYRLELWYLKLKMSLSLKIVIRLVGLPKVPVLVGDVPKLQGLPTAQRCPKRQLLADNMGGGRPELAPVLRHRYPVARVPSDGEGGNVSIPAHIVHHHVIEIWIAEDFEANSSPPGA